MSRDSLSICIVTPCLNQAQFLESCIRSVLDPEYPLLDYVIMDGGSTDGSVDIINKYSDRLKHWCSQPDDGPYAAITAGFAQSGAEIFGWINADDMLTPWVLPVIGQMFADCPDVDWVTTEIQLGIGPEGFPITHKILPGISSTGFYNAENLPGSGVGHAIGYIQQESTFWRRSLWDKANSHNHPLAGLAGDFDLWARFFQHTPLYTIDVPLGMFRFHGQQRSVLDQDGYVRQALGVLRRYGNPRPQKAEISIARYMQWCKIDIAQLRQYYETRHVVRYDTGAGRYIAREIKTQVNTL